MRGVDPIENQPDFIGNGRSEFGRRELQAGLDQRRILLGRQIRVLLFVVDDPALAFGNHLIAKFLNSKFISPLTKRAFCELLNIPLMDECDCLQPIVECVLDRHSHQSLGRKNRNGLDANA